MSKTKLTREDKALILYGYLWRLAEEAKEQGCFKDLTVKEVMHVFTEDYK